MKTKTYSPNSIAIPAELGLHRTLPFEGTPPDVRDDTIYYDVFYKHDNSCIIAIGVSLLNLEPALLPLEIFSGGRKLKYSSIESFVEWKWNHGRNPTLVIPVPDFLRDQPVVELTFRFKLFEQQVKVSRNPPAPPCNLTLATHQKNNRIQWIVDWARWHHRLHGVDRVILYDNGSEDYGELLNALEDMDDPIEKTLVRWDFPFTHDIWNSPPTSEAWSQVAMLNHCYFKFGHRGWLLNLDIDEYLVGETFFASRLGEASEDVLYFDMLFVMNIPRPDSDTGKLTFRDYEYRRPEPANRQLPKYACRFGMPYHLGNHRVRPLGLHSAVELRLRRANKMVSRALGKARNFSRPTRRVAGLMCRICQRLFSKGDERKFSGSFLMYRFRGLTDGWKIPARLEIRKVGDYRPGTVVRDDTMLKQAAEHGLMETSSAPRESRDPPSSGTS